MGNNAKLWWREEIKDLLGKYYREEIEEPEIACFILEIIQKERDIMFNKFIKNLGTTKRKTE